MATCEKCGNNYYSKECPHCKTKQWKQKINTNNKIDYEKNKIKRYNSVHEKEKKLTEKEKLFKTIRYAIIFFIGIIILGTIIETIYTNIVYTKTKPMINDIQEMTHDMMKANKKLMKQLEEGLKTPNFNR